MYRRTHYQIVALFIAIVLLGWCLATQVPRASYATTLGPTNTASQGAWTMTFQDEFDGTQVNRSKWLTLWWPDKINLKPIQLQAFVDDAVTVQNGVLRITADKRQYNGYEYTSGIINSRGRFAQQYGYFEMRARAPNGVGFWASFWTLPSNGIGPPEIDIVEILGRSIYTVRTNHQIGNSYSTRIQWPKSYNGPDLSADFHTYAVEWTPTMIIWYFDGKEIQRATEGVPQVPMHIIADLSIGGPWATNPDDMTPFPSYYDIDYIRIYQQPSWPMPTVAPSFTPTKTPTPTRTSTTAVGASPTSTTAVGASPTSTTTTATVNSTSTSIAPTPIGTARPDSLSSYQIYLPLLVNP